MRVPLVVGNWKMNGDAAMAGALLDAVRAARLADPDATGGVDVAVCPPYPYLALAAERLRGAPVAWGAQDVSRYDNGAYTGDVSASMLADLACRFAIVGHSERRTLFGDTDAVVAEKIARVAARGLVPIVCLGESLEEREADRTEAVLARQIAAVAEQVGALDATRLVLAYEPVWAIGTGRTASPEQAQQAHAFIRERLLEAGCRDARQVRLLYGGSVKPDNSAGLFAMPDIDGGLIGGASLVADDFMAICRAAAESIESSVSGSSASGSSASGSSGGSGASA